MTFPQIKDGVLAYIGKMGLGEQNLPVFGKIDPEPDWYVDEKNGMYANTHVTRYNHPHMVPIFHETEWAGSIEACVRVVSIDVIKRHAMEYAQAHSAPDRDPKRVYYPKLKELLQQVNPAWAYLADWLQDYHLFHYGYDDNVTARNEYRSHILDNGQVEVFARSKLHIRDKNQSVEPYLIDKYADDLVFGRFPRMSDRDGVDKPPSTLSKVPQTFKDRVAVAAFSERLVSPNHGIPSYDEPQGDWFMDRYYIEYINDVYHYVCVGERGESSRRSTADANELFNWIFMAATP